jgi:hypothetical protein
MLILPDLAVVSGFMIDEFNTLTGRQVEYATIGMKDFVVGNV